MVSDIPTSRRKLYVCCKPIGTKVDIAKFLLFGDFDHRRNIDNDTCGLHGMCQYWHNG